jgi:hypothetical protein
MPVLPLSPGAVQLRLIELKVADPPAKSETAVRAVVSAAPPSLMVMITTGPEVKVVPLGELEIADNKLIVYYHS